MRGSMATQQPGKRPTRASMPAAGGRKTTSGHRVVAAPRKNNLPLILGGVGGGVLLIIVLVVALGSGGGGGTKKKEEAPAEPAAAKPKPPDVSNLENDGKKKCEDGMSVCDAKGPALAGTAPDKKEPLRKEIEAAVKQIDEGLALFKKAKEIAGKNYNLDPYEKSKAKALKRWSADVEAEADKSCEEGMAIFKTTKPLWEQTLTPEQSTQLKEQLLKAKHHLEHANNLRERSQELTGHQFETREAGQAYKLLKNKLLELK